MQMTKVKSGKIQHSSILRTAEGLFAPGKNNYADITSFRNDAFFCDCLKLSSAPSEETLRQQLDELGQSQNIPGLAQLSNLELFKRGFERPPSGKFATNSLLWETLPMIRSFSTIASKFFLNQCISRKEVTN